MKRNGHQSTIVNWSEIYPLIFSDGKSHWNSDIASDCLPFNTSMRSTVYNSYMLWVVAVEGILIVQICSMYSICQVNRRSGKRVAALSASSPSPLWPYLRYAYIPTLAKERTCRILPHMQCAERANFDMFLWNGSETTQNSCWKLLPPALYNLKYKLKCTLYIVHCTGMLRSAQHSLYNVQYIVII